MAVGSSRVSHCKTKMANSSFVPHCKTKMAGSSFVPNCKTKMANSSFVPNSKTKMAGSSFVPHCKTKMANSSFVPHCKTKMVHSALLRLLVFCVLAVLHCEATVETVSDQPKPVCTVKGRVYTELKWYGYLVQKPLMRKWAKIQYQITYPVSECCTDLLIYYDDQIRELKESMSCEQRVNILPANNNQVIPLYKNNRTVGCNVWNETGEPYYVCLGERIFRSSGARTWYFALSRCNARKSLNLNYVFNISGYYGDCEADPLSKILSSAPAPVSDRFLFVAVGLGIVAGIALILASVFLALWLLSRRRSGSKGSSVTSSQATMTQDDVFYVNPSLSDREQTDYSQSSSENYYEVIPERRSYESINTHLTVPGHAHSSRHAHSTLLKEMRPFAPTFVFDDYPPPPYQPPRGMPKHHTLHHPQHGGQHPLIHPQAHAHAHAHMHAHGPHSLPLQHQHPLQQRERPLQTHTETSA